MTIRDSQIMQTALTKLFPFAVMFSLYIFSYSGVFPGGGFQAGVVIGTLVVIIEMALERKLYMDSTFERIELTGILILVLLLITGMILSGYPFGGLFHLQGSSDPFANLMIWTLSLAIFFEVAGSMVLIFRGFLFWESEEELLITLPHQQKFQNSSPRQKEHLEQKIIGITTAVTLGFALIFIAAVPPPEVASSGHEQAVRAEAQLYSIRNMVSAVYLGPRVVDTFLEVMVVVLTVFGINAVRRNP